MAKEISFKINIEGISNEASELEKISFQISNLKKEKLELLKVAKSEGILSTENKLKLAAYTKEINNQEAGLKTLKRVVDTANDSLERKKALLIQLTTQSNKASESVAAKMAPAIKKLNDEIKQAEASQGTFNRNVGNYPEMAGAAADGMDQLSGAVGGVTAQVGTAATSFLSAGGVVGVFTATIGALAAAWKRTQENIELYLGSADKLKYGYAGFAVDAETARKDAIRRSSGQITTGRTQLTEANRVLEFGGSTAEQKEQAKLMADQAKAMIEEGQLFRDQVIGIKDKITWTLKYNKLLQEGEDLADEKLEKEIIWEELEANLIKQRVIVSSQESTALQRKLATVEADKIANKLVTEKTDYINRQMKNIEDISVMTFTQEVVEDKIYGLLKEKNTIQKEYYSDQVKINKLDKVAEKDNAKAVKDLSFQFNLKKSLLEAEDKMKKDFYDKWKKLVEDEKKEATFKSEFKNLLGLKDKDLGLQQNKEMADKTKAITTQAEKDEVKVRADAAKRKEDLINAGFQGAEEGANAAFEAKKNRLNAEMQAELSNENLTEKQKKDIQRKYAKEQQSMDIKQAIINGALAIGKTFATLGFPAGLLGAAVIALSTGIQIATIKAQKFATGGKIQGGLQIHPDTSKDNTLIYVKQGETVLNQQQVARLGGSAAMRKIRVPGYAEGGYVGQIAPEISSNAFDYAAIARLMNSIEVRLDINKVRSASQEVQVITETQRI